jgi:undecaprenyl-diphosphatase
MAGAVVKRVLELDEAALLRLRRFRAPVITRCMRVFTHLGDAPSWVFVASVLLAVGGDAARYGALLGTAALSATVLSQVLKRTCKRRRPSAAISDFAAIVENPDAFSFPSGHTAAAMAVAIAFVGHPWLGPLQLALACAIALSRVYLGAHYPLDVGIGALLGALSGAFARFILQ